jgi:hypothetical protein
VHPELAQPRVQQQEQVGVKGEHQLLQVSLQEEEVDEEINWRKKVKK